MEKATTSLSLKMSKSQIPIIFLLITTSALPACVQSTVVKVDQNHKVSLQNTDTAEIVKADIVQLERTVDTAYLRLVAIVEKRFLKRLKEIDKDLGETNFLKLSKILKRNKKSVYDLYLELSEIKKNAVSVARANGIQIRADGSERILNNYYFYLKTELAAGKISFQNKYGFDNRFLQYFENNYCDCYERSEAVYCNGDNCLLVNGEFWKHQ